MPRVHVCKSGICMCPSRDYIFRYHTLVRVTFCSRTALLVAKHVRGTVSVNMIAWKLLTSFTVYFMIRVTFIFLLKQEINM